MVVHIGVLLDPHASSRVTEDTGVDLCPEDVEGILVSGFKRGGLQVGLGHCLGLPGNVLYRGLCSLHLGHHRPLGPLLVRHELAHAVHVGPEVDLGLDEEGVPGILFWKINDLTISELFPRRQQPGLGSLQALEPLTPTMP